MARMATMRTCHVTEAIIPIHVRKSIPADTTKIMEKGMSKSKILKSDEACKSRNI
jgi:hypothetical protein